MKKPIIACLALSIITSMSYAEEENKENTSSEKVIADFKSETATLQWRSINDGVMGGLSKGSSSVTEASHLRFKGSISLQNNGGFSSIRTSGSKHDLTGFKGIQIRLKGDGRMYYLTARNKGNRMLAFWSPLQTKKDEWITLKVPFDSFYATSFGRKIKGKELDIKNITSFGFMLYDKKAGDFSLEVSDIKSYK